AIRKWQEFTTIIDDFENATGKEQGGPLGGIANAMTRLDEQITQAVINLRGKVVGWIKKMWADVVASSAASLIIKDISHFVGAVVGWFARLPGRVSAWVKKTWADARRSFLDNPRLILADVRRFLDRVVSFFTGFYTRLRNSL